MRVRLEVAEVFEVSLAAHADFTSFAATDRLLLQFAHPVTKVTEVGGWLHFMASRAFEEPKVRRAPGT